MSEQNFDDLREQVTRAIESERMRWEHVKGGDPLVVVYAPDAAEAAVAVFAERERELRALEAGANAKRYDDGYEDGGEAARRELRARIEALPKWSGNAGKVLLERADVLAEFDEAVSDGE